MVAFLAARSPHYRSLVCCDRQLEVVQYVTHPISKVIDVDNALLALEKLLRGHEGSHDGSSRYNMAQSSAENKVSISSPLLVQLDRVFQASEKAVDPLAKVDHH